MGIANKKEMISVMVPCYNEEAALPLYAKEMKRIMGEMPDYDFEVILCDDGSADGTLQIMRDLSSGDKRYRYISFSRNFGKEAAMYALLQAAKGDYVVYMDADLQDPPALLPQMMSLLKEKKVDSVGTRRSNRKGEPVIRSALANLFYKLMGKISNIRLVPAARDYRLMTRKMANAVLSLCEYNRFSKGIFEWVGFKTEWIAYENIQRAAGKTKFNIRKLFKYSVECIVGFSTAPLSVASTMGFIFCITAFIGIIVIIIRYFCGVESAFGWPSTMCVILFVGGIMEYSIGILGTYLSRSYMETKKRPLYLVQETEEDNDVRKE